MSDVGDPRSNREGGGPSNSRRIPGNTAGYHPNGGPTAGLPVQIGPLQPSVSCSALLSPRSSRVHSQILPGGAEALLVFLQPGKKPPISTYEETLLMFVSYLAKEGLTHSSTKVYLSAVRHLQAACCLAFFGFLCCGEFTVPAQNANDPKEHLSLPDIAIDSSLSPTVIQVKIKQSKTNPFRQGVQWARLVRVSALYWESCHTWPSGEQTWPPLYFGGWLTPDMPTIYGWHSDESRNH